MKIERANPIDNEILTQITKSSKAYWNYSDELLKKWENDLTITSIYIEENETYKLVLNEKVIGYYSFFATESETVKLDNIFVLPDFIGKGFGKALMEHFFEKCRKLNFRKIILDSEPNAENFYKQFGFKTVDRLQSSIKDRFLPIMEISI